MLQLEFVVLRVSVRDRHTGAELYDNDVLAVFYLVRVLGMLDDDEIKPCRRPLEGPAAALLKLFDRRQPFAFLTEEEMQFSGGLRPR